MAMTRYDGWYLRARMAGSRASRGRLLAVLSNLIVIVEVVTSPASVPRLRVQSRTSKSENLEESCCCSVGAERKSKRLDGPIQQGG